MTFKNYREESRVQWGSEGPGNLNLDQLNTGAMLRIADAAEKMALRYTELIDKAARLERSNNYLHAENRQQQRSIAALKGQITKLKRKAAQP